MRQRKWWMGLFGLCLATTAMAGEGGDTATFVDRVGTLRLNQELDARGNLGGVTIDKLGFLYVSNFRDKVWKISPEGEVETLTDSLYIGSGNAIDSRGDLYQSNFGGNTITRITRTGEVSLFAKAGLQGPVGIAIDPEDNLYVCNCTGNTISKVTPDGKAEIFAKSELFLCPNGIVFDDKGFLYVTSFNGYDVARISPQGEVEKFVTMTGGSGNTHIAFSKGFFYITNLFANRVSKVSLDGQVTLLAGTGQPGNSDGPALEATLYSPNGIAVSPAGDILYLNTIEGEYGQSKKSKIAIRTIRLVTLTQELEKALTEGGVDRATEIYKAYRADPVRGKENTVAEMVRLGYKLLTSRKVPEALTVFQLNAESNPDSAPAQYQLGEAFRYTGQPDLAIEQYKKALTIDPNHANAKSRLGQLEAAKRQ